MVVIVTLSESLGAVSVSIGAHKLELGEIGMFKGALVAALLMLATACCTIEQARRAIDWQVLVAIAASFGIGQALFKTGAAEGAKQLPAALCDSSKRQ